jgi:hypothetical protein
LPSPERKSDLSLYVANIVYGPATVAYGMATIHYVWLALATMAFFFIVAMFQLRLFRNFAKWPKISRLATLLASVYIALGFIFPVWVVHYWAAVPVLIYTPIAIIGGVALRIANIER